MRLLLRGGPAAVKEFEFSGTANNIKAGKEEKHEQGVFLSNTAHVFVTILLFK
jgi:hypothetical protein